MLNKIKMVVEKTAKGMYRTPYMRTPSEMK